MIALVILVFVEAQDATSPMATALTRAAEEGLGADAAVLVRVGDRQTPDRALLDAGQAVRATAVVRVAWQGDARLGARLEMIVTATGEVRTQTIRFDATDPLDEKGRAIGLVLASMLAPEKAARQQAEVAAAPAPPPAVLATPPSPVPPPRRWALDAAAEGGFALGGSGSGVGGAIGVRRFPTRRVGWRVGAGARFGEVASAQAASLTVSGAAGLVVSVVRPGDTERFGLALRADALLLYESLSHLSSDDSETVRQGRFLPGGALTVEGHWSLSPTLAILLAAGAEVAFGRTDVFVRQAEVAHLAPVRATVQAGLVARF